VTSLIVLPRGELNRPSSWSQDAVEESAQSFATNLAGAFEGQAAPDGSHVRFAGIEVLIDPGGAKDIGFGLEIQIEGHGAGLEQTVQSWTWAITAVTYYMRAVANHPNHAPSGTPGSTGSSAAAEGIAKTH
jgi:hypothetical protein